MLTVAFAYTNAHDTRYVRTAMCPENPGSTLSVAGYCTGANRTTSDL
jgi:hypothetical protein